MTRPLEIRILSAADTDLMHDMMTMFGQAFDEASEYNDARPCDAYLRDLLGSGTFVALAAMSGTHVIGGLVAYEWRKFEQARSEYYIYDLAVAKDRRREGIATALILMFKDIAAKRGGGLIFIQAEADDAPAVAVYSRLGKRMEVAHFEIEAA